MENKVLRRLLIVLTIIAILAFIACFGGFIYATVYYINHKNTHLVEEQATIVEYKLFEYTNFSYYNLYYEYVAPDGTKYTGLYDSNIKNFDYIEKKLNTKIAIYVDHDKHIHMLEKKEASWSTIAFLGPATVMMFVFAMVPLMNVIKYYKTKKRNDNSKIVQEQPKEKLEKVEKNKNENVKQIKKPSYGNLASLVGVFLFGFMLITMLLLYPQVLENKRIYEKANFVKVYATIDRYNCQLSSSSSLIVYSTYYVYESTEGTYEGLWQANMHSEEEAKAQLGKKVPIYVDHELKMYTKKVNTNYNASFIGMTILTIIFSIVLIVSMIIMIKFITNSVKWKKYQESIKE